jgi:putative inorganic carbon (hco3(-)) transporter
VADFAWLAVVAPVLLFPFQRPIVTVGLLALFLIEAGRRVWSAADPASHTALDLLLSIVLAAAVIGTVISPDLRGSVPKLAGILLGILAYRTIHRHCQTLPRVALGLAAVAVLGTAAIGIGALSAFAGIQSLLPAPAVPRQLGAPTIVHPNGLAGLTLLLGPGWLVLLVCRTPWTAVGAARAGFWDRPTIRRSLRALLGAATVLMLVVLMLSGSRSGILGLVISLVAVLAIRLSTGRLTRSIKVAGAAIVVLAAATVFVVVALTGARLSVDFATRFEIWDRAVMMISALPITGVGLNAFTAVLPRLAPLQHVSPALDVAHAHNVFLQTALDLGLPGLCAYLGLLGVVGVLAVAVARAGDAQRRDVALALFANVVAVHLFGMTDAIALGTKVGLFFWVNLGLLSALHATIEGRA